MQTISIQTCQNCGSLQDLLDKINLKIWELSLQRLQTLQYNLSTFPDQGKVNDLLHYRRIVQKRLYNASYPCSQYTVQDLMRLVLPLVYSTKKCLCLEEPPSP